MASFVILLLKFPNSIVLTRYKYPEHPILTHFTVKTCFELQIELPRGRPEWLFYRESCTVVNKAHWRDRHITSTGPRKLCGANFTTISQYIHRLKIISSYLEATSSKGDTDVLLKVYK